MKNKKETGFSLIELLIVIVIIGVLAAISIPSLIKSRIVAENRAAVGLLSTMRSAQLTYYARARRYGRLDELNSSQSNNLGTTQTSQIIKRGGFTFTLTTTDDKDLANTYFITAVRDNDLAFRYTLDQSGTIDRIE